MVLDSGHVFSFSFDEMSFCNYLQMNVIIKFVMWKVMLYIKNYISLSLCVILS